MYMNILDKLPFKLPFGQAEENYEYYFALSITANKLLASVWGIEGKNLRIINSATSSYTSEDDLLEASTKALDQALGDFNFEVEKILFGVPDSWLIDDDLKPEYLKVLRGLVKELDVTPMAFVSTSHAICHFLQKQTGVPTTAVLVEVDNPLTVSVVKGGKILASKVAKRSEDLPQDIERILLGFSDIEVLPSKIYTYGEGNEDRLQEEMSSFSWMAQLPFLHLPKIEKLDQEIFIKSIAFAGASELLPDNNIHPQNIIIGSNIPPKSRGITSKLPEEDLEELGPTGFVAGDVATMRRGRGEETAVSDYGDEDEIPQRSVATRQINGDDTALGFESSSKFSNFKNKYLSFLPPISLPRFKSGGLVLIVPIAVLVLLILAGLFLPKAKVTVFVDPRTIEKDATIVADPTISTIDEASQKIPGKVLESSQNGTQKGTASGKKKVGDPSKGAVVIYNKTNASKTFSAGTVLVSEGNLEFKLDSSVNIASQSAVDGGISFGKSTGNVTASVIGPDGNLAAGKELTVKDQSSSSFSAKVDSAFSGGVSKDVTVVTADDQKKLLAQLLSELKTKAKEELQGKVTADMKVIEEGFTETVVKQQYSKNVGDQASDFTLNLTVNLKGTAYNDSDLRTLVSKLVDTNIPDGYDLDISKTETQSSVSKIEKDGRLIFAAKYKASLTPRFDTEKIKKDIAFKTNEQAGEALKSLENVISTEIVVSPKLPGPLGRLPLLPQNISVDITSK